MKESIKLFCLTAILLLSGSDLFSTPLNGSYTIGNGGNYPAITSAISDAAAQGINGPVIFNIISGIYNEQISFGTIPGSSELNTLTLKSMTGNPEDVRIIAKNNKNFFIIYKFVKLINDSYKLSTRAVYFNTYLKLINFEYSDCILPVCLIPV